MVFRDWLDGQMEQRGISRRELARRLAANNPSSFDTYRAAVRNWLDVIDPTTPNEQSRAAIAEALGVRVPTREEDELLEALMARVRNADPSYQRMMRALLKYEAVA